MLKIASLDHLVLTVQDIQTTCDFYCNALGMELVRFGRTRGAQFWTTKIQSTSSR